jgi:hypothetical protein
LVARLQQISELPPQGKALGLKRQALFFVQKNKQQLRSEKQTTASFRKTNNSFVQVP